MRAECQRIPCPPARLPLKSSGPHQPFSSPPSPRGPGDSSSTWCLISDAATLRTELTFTGSHSQTSSLQNCLLKEKARYGSEASHRISVSKLAFMTLQTTED
ncbi:hypothetical protein SKAU_G00144150 [Synaphobranchus kaupii]|uniref:Uncharacterized protein n=1 Tax=Synaphobranchus kaupii TaxID=118154 RepID=A0A9Q1J3L0_SYNKA|nr:hypothetical protein SKAU_G00144150 [Synaphobranchus kaupii]